MKFRFLSFSLYLICSFPLLGQIQVSINTGGFSDWNGDAINGMPFGVLIDSDGNGFEAGDYEGFDLNLDGQFLSTRFGETGDWYVRPTADSIQTTQFAPFLDPGAGAISSFKIDPAIGEGGDAIALIWFPDFAATGGLTYGVFTHEDLTLSLEPNGSVSLDAVVDPGWAIYVFDGDVSTIPEPSMLVALVGLLAAGGSALRRRRA